MTSCVIHMVVELRIPQGNLPLAVYLANRPLFVFHFYLLMQNPQTYKGWGFLSQETWKSCILARAVERMQSVCPPTYLF